MVKQRACVPRHLLGRQSTKRKGRGKLCSNTKHGFKSHGLIRRSLSAPNLRLPLLVFGHRLVRPVSIPNLRLPLLVFGHRLVRPLSAPNLRLPLLVFGHRLVRPRGWCRNSHSNALPAELLSYVLGRRFLK